MTHSKQSSNISNEETFLKDASELLANIEEIFPDTGISFCSNV